MASKSNAIFVYIEIPLFLGLPRFLCLHCQWSIRHIKFCFSKRRKYYNRRFWAYGEICIFIKQTSLCLFHISQNFFARHLIRTNDMLFPVVFSHTQRPPHLALGEAFFFVLLPISEMYPTRSINGTARLGKPLHKELFRLAHKVKLRLGGRVAYHQILAHLADLADQLLRRRWLGGDQLFHKGLIAKQPLVGKRANLGAVCTVRLLLGIGQRFPALRLGNKREQLFLGNGRVTYFSRRASLQRPQNMVQCS